MKTKTTKQATPYKTDLWQGCYPSNWKGTIINAAMAHPAKYSSRLIHRIYEHAKELNWIQPGDKVIDPFGGVALGGLDALRLGLHWTGMELEARFVDLGNGYACPGFTKEYWMRLFGRGQRVNFNHGYHWCPDCAKKLTHFELPDETDDGQFLLFSESPKNSSRTIPSQAPHFFEGNISLWNRLFADEFPEWGSARLLQGDSRKLIEKIAEMKNVELSVSSPPYSPHVQVEKNSRGINLEKQYETYKASGGGQSFEAFCRTQEVHSQGYGISDGNLANMESGDFSLALSSPPFLQASGGANVPKGMDPALMNRHAAGNKGSHAYGKTDGQLSSMDDDGFDVAIGSPPFAGVGVESDGRKEIVQKLFNESGSKGSRPNQTGNYQKNSYNDSYGSTPGQLGTMDGRDFSAAISSPPYEAEVVRDRNSHVEKARLDRKSLDPNGSHGMTGDLLTQETYGHTDGQLADDSGDSFWLAARQIVDQVYAALKPGTHAIWVVKGYVKNKKYVDFPDQWRQLCEAAGFCTLHEHRAMLIHNKGTSRTLDGGTVEHKTESKSFFRRLAEKKGSPRIDWETVWCMVKPGENTDNGDADLVVSSPPYAETDLGGGGGYIGS